MNFIDGTKVLMHIDKLRALSRGEMVEPVSIEFDLTNKCNHRCAWCRYKDVRDQSEMSWPLIERLFAEFAAFHEPPSLVLAGGGEPTVHPQFVDAVELAASHLLQLGVFTNGSNLSGKTAEVVGKHCGWVRVSLDAGDAETYAAGHGVSPGLFTEVCRNVTEFVERYPLCPLGLTFVATDNNIKSFPEFCYLVSQLRPAYAQVRQDVNGGPAKKVAAFARNYIGKPPLYVSGSNCSRSRTCYTSPLVAVVAADRNLYRCCNYRGVDPIGSVGTSRFRDIWFGGPRIADWHNFDASTCQPCRFAVYNQLVEDCVIADGSQMAFL